MRTILRFLDRHFIATLIVFCIAVIGLSAATNSQTISGMLDQKVEVVMESIGLGQHGIFYSSLDKLQ